MRGELAGQRLDALPQHGRRDGLPSLRGELLAGRQRLPRHAIPRAAALLHHHQNAAHMTRDLELQLLDQFRRGFFRAAFDNLRLLGALRQIDALDRRGGRGASRPTRPR